MAVSISKTNEEVQQLPLVELACEILKAKKEPYYFRDLMAEIQALRGMSEEQVTNVIARLYTEINIDGRFICVGQNIWGLKRWYPVDKVADRAPSGKKFVRSSGDAFSDDDEDLDDYEEEDLEVEEVDDDIVIPLVGVEVDVEDAETDAEYEAPDEEEAVDYTEDEDGEAELEEFAEEDGEDAAEEDEHV
jgi:DNA-directed RNA polymerase subunit delta